jgi:hypothetical protein
VLKLFVQMSVDVYCAMRTWLLKHELRKRFTTREDETPEAVEDEEQNKHAQARAVYQLGGIGGKSCD